MRPAPARPSPPTGPWPAWTCPAHATALREEAERLVCAQGHAYPVTDGIPRTVDRPGYADAFGAQWLKYRTTQLDSVSGVPLSEERARRCLGPSLWKRLAGLDVLECGAGAGRFTEVLLARGARVTSVDVTSAVDANAANFPPDERHRVVMADIWDLPFAPRQYDVVFCLGVVQHTPDPEVTIAKLYEQVCPRGSLVIDHYTYSLGRMGKTATLLRPVLKRLEPQAGMAATEKLVDALLPLHRQTRGSRTGQMLLSRVSPVHCYYQHLPQLTDEQHREWALLDTHDALTDWHKHFRTRGQIRRLLKSLGLVDVWCERGGNGVEARGRRPVPAA